MTTAAAAPRRALERPHGLVIIGHPVAHSLSPQFQQAALDVSGFGLRYDRLDVAPALLGDTLRQLRSGKVGGNVTVPHKEAMCGCVSFRSTMAERVGAVNTFWWERGELVGHNTDVDGVRATLDALCPEPVAGPVLVLGAGGGAAAVLVALAAHSATAAAPVHLLARSPVRAERLLERVGIAGVVHGIDRVPNELWRSASLVVNSTPVGMTTNAMPVDPARLSAAVAVFDLVYRANGSAWVREARARGLRAEDGLRMLVEQGASAFECWFDLAAPREQMWAALGHAPPDPRAPRPLTPQLGPTSANG